MSPPDDLEPTREFRQPLDPTQPVPRAPDAGDPPDDDEVFDPPLDRVVFDPDTAVRVPAPQPSVEPARAPTLKRRRLATLAAFAEALIPPGGAVPQSAKDVGVAARIDAAASSFDPVVRARLSKLLWFWEWQSVFSRAMRPFSRVSAPVAVAVVERAAKSRLRVRKQSFTFLKILCLNQWASTPPVEAALGFTYSCVSATPPQDAPPLEVVAYPQIASDHHEECDVVVVGSGAGGAVMAKELAEAGLSVIVLEEGGSFTRADFAGPPWERFMRFYRAQGTTVALGRPIIPIPLGKAVGGTTLVNSGTCFRTPDRVLESWGSTFGIDGIDPASMRPYFERVEKILHVKPVPEEIIGDNARVFRRGVEALGLHGAPIDRNIRGCRGCGVCAFGCPSDAKQSTHISYLPRAQRHGAGIYANCKAERIIVEGGRARGVEAVLTDPRTGEPKARMRVAAKAVVIAAGAIHTPALLMDNALGNRSGQLGRNLRIHPSAGLGAMFDEEIYPWRGTLQSYYVDDWHRSHDLMIEVTSFTPGVGAGYFPGTGGVLKDMVSRAKHAASAGVLVADTSSGRVRRIGRGEPVITYSLNDVDTRKLVRGMGNIAEIFLAAGAKTVFTDLPGAPTVSNRDDLERMRERGVRPGALKLTAFHPAGTARMGADPATSVVDPWGECHDVAGLFVTDASMLPGSPTVNPMITIMAMATRTADHVVRNAASYFG